MIQSQFSELHVLVCDHTAVPQDHDKQQKNNIVKVKTRLLLLLTFSNLLTVRTADLA